MGGLKNPGKTEGEAEGEKPSASPRSKKTSITSWLPWGIGGAPNPDNVIQKEDIPPPELVEETEKVESESELPPIPIVAEKIKSTSETQTGQSLIESNFQNEEKGGEENVSRI